MAWEQYRGFSLIHYDGHGTHGLTPDSTIAVCRSGEGTRYLLGDLTISHSVYHETGNTGWRKNKEECIKAIDAFWDKMSTPLTGTEP